MCACKVQSVVYCNSIINILAAWSDVQHDHVGDDDGNCDGDGDSGGDGDGDGDVAVPCR
jgi:hypothetical protein